MSNETMPGECGDVLETRILPARGRLFNSDLTVKIAVPLLLLFFLLIALKLESFGWYAQLVQRNTYTTFLGAIGALYTLAFLAMQAVRTALWWRYRPYPLPETPLPRVTVLIPAYNEGSMVEKAIYSVAAADYPSDRLEIICIDDGSQDDTWHYIRKAVQRYPDLIQAIRFSKNRGKREALYAGFHQGRGDYFVTVDSDSIIEPNALKQILAPMLKNPGIGAVAGNVKVYNRDSNLLTRMLWVRFVLSFDFLRASQSMYGFVFCTPGALSGFRREAIFPVLDEWRCQTFLGARCTIGEDRAFTNLVLRQGYDTVYQRNAIVYTTVPETYRGLTRMFLRWDRSDFRESLVQFSFMFTRYRPRRRLLPIVDFFIRELEFPLTCIYLPLLLLTFICYPVAILKFVSALGLVSFLLTLYYLREERDMDFIYGVIYSLYAFLFLRWVRPYALLTVRDGRWLTR
jgi:hyaluronan synthase